MTSMADIHTIDQARDAAAAQCMRSRGFTTWTDGIIQSWSPEDYLEAEPLEFIDPQQVAQSGYPKPRVDPQLAAQSNRSEDRRGPTPEEMKAYDGTRAPAKPGRTVQANGCLAEGKARLYGAQQDLPADPRALDDDASISAMQDSRVGQALEEWNTCITTAGLTYDSPITAKHDVRWAPRDSDTDATAEEKRVAQIDAQCQRQINLVGIYTAAKIAYEKRMVAERRTQLEASQNIIQGWVANARSILNAS